MIGRNRWIAALLSASLVFTMMPAGAVAAEEPQAAQTEEQIEETVQEESAASSEEETASEEEEKAEVPDTSESEGEQASVEENQEEDADKEAVTDESAEGTESDPSQDEEAAAESGEEVAAAGASDTAAEEKLVIPEGTVIPGEEPEMAVTDGDGVDPDDKYEMFINRAFFGSSASGRRLLKASGRLVDRLGSSERKIYDRLVIAAEEISRGERDTGLVKVPTEEITNGERMLTADDLNLSYIVENGSLNPEIRNALMEKYPVDYSMIQNVLIAECPYEMFPLTGGVSHPVWLGYQAVYDGQSWMVELYETQSFGLIPNANFALDSDDRFAINSEKIRGVLHAADTAKKIVDNADGMSDYYKLCYYKEKICDLVIYNDDAREQGENYSDKGAWSLLNVFDGDSSTNVVCEGYSEAFQYLCDLTSFSGDTYVYCVTGVMAGGTGGGDHKWNIVHIDDENYLADITNSDAGTTGSDGKLFLAGVTGSVDGGYTKEWPGREEEQEDGSIIIYYPGSISYTYDGETRNTYTVDELTLSNHDYGAPVQTTADDKAVLKGMNLFLTDKIGMRVYVKPVNGYELDPEDSIVFTCNNESITQRVCDAGQETITDYDGNEINVLVFEYELWTKQMTDDVSFHLVVDNEAGKDKTYSVRSYADEILRGGYSEDEKAMVRAMLNYGGYAQKCFDYSTDNLANNGIFGDSDDPVMQEDPDLGEEYKYTLSQADDTNGFKFDQASLVLTTDVSLVYSFKLGDGKSVSDYEFRIKGSDKKPVVKYNDYFDSDCVMIEHILPYELNKMYELEVVPKGDSAAVVTLKYGPFSYCRSKIAKGKESVRNVCKAIYYYWKAAENLR